MANQLDGDDDISVFRPTKSVIYTCIGIAAVSAIVVLAYLTSLLMTLPAGEAILTSAPWLVVSFMLIVTAMLLRVYRIEADADGLKVVNLIRSRYIKFKNIKKITFKKGFRNGDLLQMYDQNGRRLLSVSSSVDDLDGLLQTVRSGARGYGATFRRRDEYGTWVQPSI